MTESPPSLSCLAVGMGGISRAMLRNLAQKPWFRCAGLVDVSQAALETGGELAGVPPAARFTDLGQALATLKPDAALVNTPSELHDAQTRLCLEAGCHTLVAKPVTNDYAEALALVELSRRCGLTLSVGQQMRHNRHYAALTRFVQSGELGRVEAAWFMNSKPRPQVANLGRMLQPSLYENACHHFDAFLAVFGADPERISGDGFVPSWSRYAGPCMVNALIRFAGGLHLSYHGGFSSQAPIYEFRLEGTAGALRCRGLHMSNDTMAYEFAPALGQFSPRPLDEGVAPYDPFLPFLDRWHDYLRGGPEPPFSGRQNLRVFALLCAAIESVETGRPVDITVHPLYRGAFAEARA